MLANVPVSTRLLVPVPVTVTVAVPVAVRAPVGTLRVTVWLVVAAPSGSAMLKPVRPTLVSSVPAKVVGSVLTGASLTREMLMMDAAELLSVAPSSTVTSRLRATAAGASVVLLKVMACSASK